MSPAASSPLNHKDLVVLAERWARQQGFHVTAPEMTIIKTPEIPDLIAFNSSGSIMIECKVSRSDFLIDKKKPWRQPNQGMGNYRLYIAPEGIIKPEDLTKMEEQLGCPRWGLLEVTPKKKIIEKVVPIYGFSNPSHYVRMRELMETIPHAYGEDGEFNEMAKEQLEKHKEDSAFWHPSDAFLERAVLYSLARRNKLKKPV